jgi:hypothetical protein
MWERTVESDRPQTIIYVILCMRFASWITKVTYTHSEYVILIVFPRQN